MNIEQHYSLKNHNTFGIDVEAQHFLSVNSIEQLRAALNLTEFESKFILGGGSNMLLTKNIGGLVLHINLKGIEILKKTESHAYVKASAGENWHEFVLYCISHGFGGLENLSLIPGNVGTAPIQNIGAYGVELKDTFETCTAMHINSGELKTFDKEDCAFGYRDSIFKSQVKGSYIITSVTFKLTRGSHELHMDYGAIEDQLADHKISNPTITDISNAVIAIRQSKLPDPKKIGNSGSFFKNPMIGRQQYEALLDNFPSMPHYPINETEVKVPAGWLIEAAGFKGKTFGNYGVHKNQALVLVNYGGATGNDIRDLSVLITETIERIFGIQLETEVNII